MSESTKPITGAMVKELRDRTSAGMMECKKYLQKAEGDIELAIELMRKEGALKAAKKEGRITKEGLIVIMREAEKSVMLEINCETDFVVRGEDFQQFAQNIAQAALAHATTTVEALLAVEIQGRTVEAWREDLVAKIGENINVRRVHFMPAIGTLHHYQHGNKIGVLLDMSGADQELLKDIAMHIAANAPVVIQRDQVPEALVEKEREIYLSQAKESGKPAEIIEKIVNGQIYKFMDSMSLVEQPFVKNPELKVKELLAKANATVNQFCRYAVGEGIEKQVTDFATEVAKVRGT